jgi:hypothetical protein
MKQMKREIKIAYRWWRSDGKAIKPAHVGALEESADDRIREMMKDGYVEGELRDNIHMTDRDPEDGIDYSGHWKVVKTSEPSAKLKPKLKQPTVKEVLARGYF